ncbi:pyrroline-5-carboxylate reductase [Neobacillus dielmonensis]|uniref:pyrroline-5-carboxylate reductase n=1 Tax=Neobacillus dielmonensis TaxID=1347369 RepID=UPI0005AA0967|nr:pyrroline-5-carboxylate reductase [Neobacillus dielmonensis]
MVNKKTIAFIGAGAMAEAMISGVVSSNSIPAEHIFVTNRSNTNRLKQLENEYGINGIPQNELEINQMDVIILAMKPKDAETSLQIIRNIVKPHQLILSVIAGLTTSSIERMLPEAQQVIRAMPNTSCKIGESATALSRGKNTTNLNFSWAIQFFECIGKVYVIPEEQMHTFTGIAGSGPAYYYYFMECMEKEGIKANIPKGTIRQIVAQTILGAAKMIQEQGESPEVLRENITSPNGTTAAGLKALFEHGGGEAITHAVLQAAIRSCEISHQLDKSILSNKVQQLERK